MKKAFEGLVLTLMYIGAFIFSNLAADSILKYLLPAYHNIMGLQILASLLFIAFVLVTNWKKLDKNGWFTSFSKKELYVTLKISLASVLLVTFFLTFIFPGFYDAFMPDDFQQIFEELGQFDPYLVLFALGVLAPVAEELLFRGAIYNTLKNRIGSVLAVIISALLFAAIHLNIYQGSYALILGLLLGLVVYRTGSLWLAMIFHVTYNSLSGIVNSFSLEFQEFLFIKTFLAPIIGIILMYDSLRYFLGKSKR